VIDAQTISEALGGKRSGAGYLACCPAHDDHHPSFSIHDGHNGKPVVHCLAGCSQGAVIAALTERGLWPEKDGIILSRAELDALRERSARLKAEREAEKLKQEEQAATKARKRWEAAPLANQVHPYLTQKHIMPHGIRQDGDKLLVPMRDERGTLWTLQTIDADGEKRFSPFGCRTKGLYLSIGQPAPGGPVCIVEGFATGAAIYEATGDPVACSMTAGNLEAVARTLKAKLPGHPFVVCADDDQEPGAEKNPGLEAATKAALAVGGRLAVPDMGRKSDFWDLWNENEQGADAVRAAIATAQPVTDQQGGGAGLAEDNEIISSLLERVKTDCGAVYEPDVVSALNRLKQRDKAEFMRLRARLKKANPDVMLGELSKDMYSFSHMGSKLSCPPPTLSTLSTTYPTLTPALKDKIQQFQNILIRDGQREGEQELCPHSEAALLLAGKLKGLFAYAIESACWYRFEDAHWKESKQLATDEAVTALLYAGAGHLGFSNAYQTGVSALLTKGRALSKGVTAKGIIPFENGLLDVAAKTLIATTPENALTWCLPFKYIPAAQCPQFIQWLETALDGDRETVLLLRAFINATLTGRPDLQRFMHLIGPAGTGKSTFGRLLFAIVGAANSTTTTLKQLEQNRFETAGIHGKRLVCIEEADKYGGSVSVLKAMTGQDPLRLERKNQQQSGNFIYGGQVLMMSNERLATTDYTSGIERRRVTVEFSRRITAEERAGWERRGGEEAILHAEIPGVINWALELSRDQVTEAFRLMPSRVLRANLEASLFNNPLADWLVEHCIPSPEAKGQIGDGRQVVATTGERVFINADERLYPNYLLWCQRSGRENVSLQRFSSTLVDAAQQFGAQLVKKRTGELGTHLEGVRLRRDGEQSWKECLEGWQNPTLVQVGVEAKFLKVLGVEEVEGKIHLLSVKNQHATPHAETNLVTVEI